MKFRGTRRHLVPRFRRRTVMKKLFLKSVLILAALYVATGAGHAQAAQDTPESIAKAYFAAMQAGDWAKCASFMHDDALAAMKRTFNSVIIADKRSEERRVGKKYSTPKLSIKI